MCLHMHITQDWAYFDREVSQMWKQLTDLLRNEGMEEMGVWSFWKCAEINSNWYQECGEVFSSSLRMRAIRPRGTRTLKPISPPRRTGEWTDSEKNSQKADRWPAELQGGSMWEFFQKDGLVTHCGWLGPAECGMQASPRSHWSIICDSPCPLIWALSRESVWRAWFWEN